MKMIGIQARARKAVGRNFARLYCSPILNIREVIYYVSILLPLYDSLLRRRYSGDNARPIPPLPLRTTVGGTMKIDEFISSGRQCFSNLELVLRNHEMGFDNFTIILDFGCGCGRTLRWFEEWQTVPGRRIWGVDIDKSAVDWCKKNLDFASFELSRFEPPLDLSEKSIDLIYAVSVFSHLEEGLHLRWLREFRRVLTPGGLALISIHGKSSYESYIQGWRNPFRHHNVEPDEMMTSVDHGSNEFDIKRFVFIPIEESIGFAITFISPLYIEENWTEFLELVEIVPAGMSRAQDLVVLRNLP